MPEKKTTKKKAAKKTAKKKTAKKAAKKKTVKKVAKKAAPKKKKKAGQVEEDLSDVENLDDLDLDSVAPLDDFSPPQPEVVVVKKKKVEPAPDPEPRPVAEAQSAPAPQAPAPAEPAPTPTPTPTVESTPTPEPAAQKEKTAEETPPTPKAESKKAPPPKAPPKKAAPKATYKLPPEPKATYKLPPGATDRPAKPAGRFANRPAPSPRPARPAHPKRKGKQQPPARKPEDTKAPEQAAAETPKAETPKKELKPLEIPSNATVGEIAQRIDVKASDLIKKLMEMGVYVTINQRLDAETCEIVGAEFGYAFKFKELYGEKELESQETVEESPENLEPRPPIITVMGHVDHGKTSVLDALRETDIAAKEAGGITQHLGASKIKTKKGDMVFLDTPGHEAFTAMRARGANVTDIVVLVVSAVDGVQPQTIEAIDHAKAASVKIVVAVNKIDLPGANPQKIRQELAQHGVQSEDWGGEVQFVDISAKKKQNLEALIEAISLETEMLELKANPDRPGLGVILEAKMDSKRGNVAMVLVQNGTVRVGDAFVAGLAQGRIRALIDSSDQRIKEAGPSTPVEILGAQGLTPETGDKFNVVSSDRQAKDIASRRKEAHRTETLEHRQRVSLQNLRERVEKGVKELLIILKADAQGSVQAIRDQLEKIHHEELGVRVIHAGVGDINESDILLAKASEASVLGFHVGADGRAKREAEKVGIEIRRYKIIYELLEDVRAALEGLLAPETVEVDVGKVEVRQIFKVRHGEVAGSFVLEGKVQRGAKCRVVRGEEVLHQGTISMLKRFKDDVKEVEKGYECGLIVEGFKGYQAGDVVAVYAEEQRTRRLEDPKGSAAN